jgi:hypothetical protein
LSASGTTWSPQTGRRCFMNAPDPVRPQIWPVTKPPSLLSLSSPRTCLLVHLPHALPLTPYSTFSLTHHFPSYLLCLPSSAERASGWPNS